MQIGVLILAAGYSKRMGQSKALLKYDINHTFLEQLIDQYFSGGVKDIKPIIQGDMLELNSSLLQTKNIVFIKNNHPELGRSYSIHIGLQHFKNHDFVFLQNIDNPFTSKDLIKLMISKAESEKAIIPVVAKKNAHPILIPKKLISQILSEPPVSMDFRTIFSKFPKQFVNFHDVRISANINTPEDYNKWIGL